MTAVKEKAGSFLRRSLSCGSVSYEQAMALFLPVLAENIFTIGFSLLNSSMISSAGMAALSAVNLVDTYTTMIATVFQGLATGAAIVVAQYRGARRFDQMKEAAEMSVSAVTALAVLLTILSMVLRKGVIALFFGGAEKDVLEIADYYLLWSCVTLPIYAVVVAELGVLRGIGEGRIALVITIVNSIVYILGNFLFIVVLKLAIPGLLLSITITRLATFAACFIVKKMMRSTFLHNVRDLLALDAGLLKRISQVGFPVSFENLLFNGGRLVLQMIIVPLGTNAIASYNIAYSIMAFSQIPNGAMSTMMFTAAGMCMGARRPDDCKYLFKNVCRLNIATYIVIGIAIVALHAPITAAFHAEPDMYGVIFASLVIIALAQVLTHTPGFMTANVLHAAGDIAYPTVVSAVSMWLFRVLGAYLLGIVLGLGVPGVYLAMSMDWTARAIVMTLRYRAGKWEKMHVI